MSDAPPERRDIQGLIADIRVDVATIKERTLVQGKTLDEVKLKIDGNVSRGEYEARNKELEDRVTSSLKTANDSRDETLRRQGAERVWKLVFSAALATLGVIETVFHR